MNCEKNNIICICIKDEPLDVTMSNCNNDCNANTISNMENIESKVETILTSIKRESIKNLMQQNENNFDIDIDLNLLNENKPDNLPPMVPLLKKPPKLTTLYEPVVTAENSTPQKVLKMKQIIVEPQQSIPIISITNFNNHLIDPRIEYQNKHFQNQLKKLFIIISANNHQQIKLNNNVFKETSVKLDYELEDLKSKVEINLRTNLTRFQHQILLPDYYEMTCQLDYIFNDLTLLQEKVCSDHNYLNDLYDYLNEIKLVFAVKLKRFFKGNQLPELFEKIMKPIPVPQKARLSYAHSLTTQIENNIDIRDPRLRKQQEAQIKASMTKTINNGLQKFTVPTTEMINKKYFLDFKCLKYNLSNETPKSPTSPSHKAKQQEQVLVQKSQKIVSNNCENLPLLMSSPNEFTQELCENIRHNVINETNSKKQEEYVHQILNLLNKLVNKNSNVEEEKSKDEEKDKHERKRSRTRHNRSRSSHKRHRSHSKHHRHESDDSHKSKKKNSSRSRSHSRSRSRSGHRRKHSSSKGETSRSKRDRSLRTSTSSSMSSKSSTASSESSAPSTTITTKTRTNVRIFYNNQEEQECSSNSNNQFIVAAKTSSMAPDSKKLKYK